MFAEMIGTQIGVGETHPVSWWQRPVDLQPRKNERKEGGSQSTFEKLNSASVGASFPTTITSRHYNPVSSSFQCTLMSATLQGESRSSVSRWHCTPLILLVLWLHYLDWLAPGSPSYLWCTWPEYYCASNPVCQFNESPLENSNQYNLENTY